MVDEFKHLHDTDSVEHLVQELVGYIRWCNRVGSAFHMSTCLARRNANRGIYYNEKTLDFSKIIGTRYLDRAPRDLDYTLAIIFKE
jgi:hypothetical protein